MTTPGGIVIDTSAVVAILLDEPEAASLAARLDEAEVRLVSAATVVELGIVMEARAPRTGRDRFDRFIERCEVVPVDLALSARALDGWRRFGKGNHPAALNYGDCFTYALAVQTGFPILCGGNDFLRTDAGVVDLGG